MKQANIHAFKSWNYDRKKSKYPKKVFPPATHKPWNNEVNYYQFNPNIKR